MFQRQGAAFIEEKLDFIEPVMGLFHVQMNMLKLMIMTYWGRPDAKDPASLQHFLKMVGNNRVKRDAKDFNGCLSFINDVLDAHVLSACFTAVGVHTLDGLAARIHDGANWTELVEHIAHRLYTPALVHGWRCDLKNDDAEIPIRDGRRDLPLENAMLFMRDMLVFRDYESAVKDGDTGRIEKALDYWCILFQGTSLKNYPNEMVHLILCLRKLWSKEYRKVWLDHCLVNISGQKGAWMPDDRCCEHVVRENKARIHPSSNALTGDFNREVTARQILTYRDSRHTMYRITGSTDYGMRSRLAQSLKQVLLFAGHMSENGILKKTAGGRFKGRDHDSSTYYIAQDLYSDGCRKIASGEVLAKYKSRARANWPAANGIDSEDFEGGDDGDGMGGLELPDEELEAEF